MSQFHIHSGFAAELDQMSKQEWTYHLRQFDDANLYQTWQYNSLMPGGKRRSHIVLYRNGQVIALAQVRIMKLPCISRGIAYVYRGPLWQLRGGHNEPDILRQIVSAMYREYVSRRHLLLRFVPNIIMGKEHCAVEALQSVGLSPCKSGPPYRTILLDIVKPLDQLREELRQKWRNCLNNAERNHLKIYAGADDNMFAAFCGLYDEMLTRKRFKQGVDVNTFRVLQRILSDREKMIILLAEHGGKAIAGAVSSALGDTGIYLLAATNEQGRKQKASYIIIWRLIGLLKERGCKWFDLGGIDPERNPGGYHFKSGLGGEDCCYMSECDAYQSPLSNVIVTIGDGIKKRIVPYVRRLLLTTHG